MPLLFSYGTLQDPSVQLSVFGHHVSGESDELLGYTRELFRGEEPAIVGTSGTAHYAIVRFTGRAQDRVRGTVLEMTDDDLTRADDYEPAGYVRVRARLASGRQGWVYAAE